MTHNTRYEQGEKVIYGDREAKILEVRQPQSDSPKYVLNFLDDKEHPPEEYTPGGERFKASHLKKAEDNWQDKAQRELENHLDVDTEMKGAYHLQVQGTGKGVSLIAKDGQEGSNGEREWMVFKDRSEAKEAAIDEVYRNLENRPQHFRDRFLRSFIYVPDDTANRIAKEDARALYEGHDEEEIVEEAHAHGFDTDDPQKARRKLEEKRADDYYDRIKDDPMQFFVGDRGMYSEETLLQQDFIEIRKEEAAEQAVRADGEANYLDHYDGKGIELPSGAVAYGAN
jgi:hypothetical protein